MIVFPVLASLAVFSEGIDAWFQQDDFAHLKLAAQTPLSELPSVLVRPIAQGTFRPLSERLFYWSAYHIAGLDPLPFRIVSYGAQIFCCTMYVLLLRRIVGSGLAAAVGATVWATHPCLTLPVTWIATTNQLLWIACLLSALYGFVLYCDTGRRGYLRLSWAGYLLGFGMLESNVAVAALIPAYAAIFHRERLLHALAYVPPAIVFAGLHFALIPRAGGKTYGMHVGAESLQALWTYWKWSWVLEPSALSIGIPAWVATLAAILSILGVAGLLACKGARKEAAFGLCCWLILLAPMLPLTQHLSDYYLAAPLLGGGIILAAGIRHFPRTGLPLAVLLGIISVPASRYYASTNVHRSKNIESLVKGVSQITAAHPGKTILLAGVGDDLFWSGVYDRPFTLVGAGETYLAPDTAAGLTPYPELFQPGDYTLPAGAVAAGLARNEIVVYTAGSRRLVESTYLYKASRSPGEGSGSTPIIDFRNPLYASFLGREWYEQEDGFRWMPRTATATLSGQGTALSVRGVCASAQFSRHNELRVTAEWNGTSMGTQAIQRGGADFTLDFSLPKNRAISGVLRLTVDPVTRVPGDTRELGLAVTRIEIK